MPSDPDEGENGELQPDPAEPSGGASGHRDHAERIEEHSRPTTAPTDQEATRPGTD